MSVCCLNDDSTIHTNGNRKGMMIAVTRAKYPASFRTRNMRSLRLGFLATLPCLSTFEPASAINTAITSDQASNGLLSQLNTMAIPSTNAKKMINRADAFPIWKYWNPSTNEYMFRVSVAYPGPP